MTGMFFASIDDRDAVVASLESMHPDVFVRVKPLSPAVWVGASDYIRYSLGTKFTGIVRSWTKFTVSYHVS